MLTMQEALARERMREVQARSQEAKLARELAAARRWHRVARVANAAHSRHVRQVSRLVRH